MQSVYQGIGDTIADGVVGALKGAVDGTMSLAQAATTLLNDLSNQMLQIARNILFYGNITGTLNEGSGIFGTILQGLASGLSAGTSGVTPLPGSAPPMTTGAVVTPTGFEGQFAGFAANGGPVKGGKSYIVGEKGPELFTPRVSGGITPNHALGGSNIVVNVDASGSSVEGDAQQQKALGAAIGAAVQAEIIKQKRPGGLLF